MYFFDALQVVWRRWLVVALGVVLTAGAAVGAVSIVNTQYQATGEVLLLPPSAPYEDGDPINPYLSLPNSLVFTASLIASSVSSTDAVEATVAEGFLPDYTVAVIPGTGPLVAISVASTDRAAAIATRDELISQLDADLVALQDVEDVREDQRIVARVVSAPRAPKSSQAPGFAPPARSSQSDWSRRSSWRSASIDSDHGAARRATPVSWSHPISQQTTRIQIPRQTATTRTRPRRPPSKRQSTSRGPPSSAARSPPWPRHRARKNPRSECRLRRQADAPYVGPAFFEQRPVSPSIAGSST